MPSDLELVSMSLCWRPSSAGNHPQSVAAAAHAADVAHQRHLRRSRVVGAILVTGGTAPPRSARCSASSR